MVKSNPAPGGWLEFNPPVFLGFVSMCMLLDASFRCFFVLSIYFCDRKVLLCKDWTIFNQTTACVLCTCNRLKQYRECNNSAYSGLSVTRSNSNKVMLRTMSSNVYQLSQSWYRYYI